MFKTMETYRAEGFHERAIRYAIASVIAVVVLGSMVFIMG